MKMKNGIFTAIIVLIIGISASAQAQGQEYCDKVVPGTRWDGKKCTQAPKHSSLHNGAFADSPTGTRSAPVSYSNSRYRSKTASSKDEIYARCTQKWGTDYEMVEYCIKNQPTARSAVSSRRHNGIKQRCQEKWGTDSEMVDYCIKNQTKAKGKK